MGLGRLTFAPAVRVVPAVTARPSTAALSIPPANGPRRSIMMSVMCAELLAQAHIDAAPRSMRLAEHLAVHTPRRSDAG
jgi:hypothetical protein